MANKYNVTKDVFSKRLRKLMLDNNETTYSVAEIVNLSAATISRYADGKMAPKITTITHLANHFNVNPVWLMGYDVPKVIISENIQPVSLSDKEKTLLDNYNKLNDSGKEKLLEYSDDLTTNIKYIKHDEPTTLQDLNPALLAAHDDDLTEEEKSEADRRILEAIKYMKK